MDDAEKRIAALQIAVQAGAGPNTAVQYAKPIYDFIVAAPASASAIVSEAAQENLAQLPAEEPVAEAAVPAAAAEASAPAEAEQPAAS